ncbi:MAG: hypothetical protein H7839_16635 [Magnetococcus sp. YQC-5]
MDASKTKTLLAAWVTCMAVAGAVNAIECPPGSQQAECLEQEKARQQGKPQPAEKQPQPVEMQRQPTEQNAQREQLEKQQQIEQQRQQRAVMEQQQREQREKQQQIEQQRQQRAVMEQQQREQLEKQQQIEQQRQQRAVMEQQQREQLEKQKQLELQRQQSEQRDKQLQAEAQQKLLEQQQREQLERQQQAEQQQKLLELQQREQRDKRHQAEIQQKQLEQQQREQLEKQQQAEQQQKLLELQQREQRDKRHQAEMQQKQLEQQQREQLERQHQAEQQQKLLEQQQREQRDKRHQAEMQQKQLEQQQREQLERQQQAEQQRQHREQREKQRQAEQHDEHEKQLQLEQSRRQREHSEKQYKFDEQRQKHQPVPSEKQYQFDEQRQKHQPVPERDRQRDKRAQRELEGSIQPAPEATSKTMPRFGTFLPNDGHRPFEPSLLSEHHHENRTPSHAIVIDQSTQAFKDDNGYTIQHQPTRDSKVVFKNKRLPDGQTLIYGYKQTRHDKDNGWTRTYLDGRRISAGPKFVKRSDPSRPFSVITHHNGLREGFTHSGRPAFREFFTETHHHHRREKVVQRTINVTTINNTVIFLDKPIVQNYAIVTFGGITVFSYYPANRNWKNYSLFDRPISITVTPECLICPPPVIVYEQPVIFYSDPVALLSDMTLATPLYEGMTPALSESQQEEIKILQNQVADLQQQINETLLANADLQNQLTDFPPEQKPSRSSKKVSTTSKERVTIPESVRVQIKLQVEQAMAYQKEGKPLSINDVIASPDVLYYLFQVAETIDAINADSGEECVLTTGDLISFNTVPNADDSSASMQVTVSKKNSCPVGAQINVGFYDLQEMLNSFSQNLEKNMDKLHKSISK